MDSNGIKAVAKELSERNTSRTAYLEKYVQEFR